jgi:hypothetical protein
MLATTIDNWLSSPDAAQSLVEDFAGDQEAQGAGYWMDARPTSTWNYEHSTIGTVPGTPFGVREQPRSAYFRAFANNEYALPCSFILKQLPCRHKHCRFAHNRDEWRATMFTTFENACHYVVNGRCPQSDIDSFPQQPPSAVVAHVATDPGDAPKTIPCALSLLGLACPFGPRCRYAHDESEWNKPASKFDNYAHASVCALRNFEPPDERTAKKQQVRTAATATDRCI